jgi:hypothetical protein
LEIQTVDTQTAQTTSSFASGMESGVDFVRSHFNIQRNVYGRETFTFEEVEAILAKGTNFAVEFDQKHQEFVTRVSELAQQQRAA